MALPKHKGSKTRKAKRKAGKKRTAPNVVECEHCHAPILPHRACPNCGYYRGRSAVTVTEKG